MLGNSLGYDLFALEAVILQPNTMTPVRTGIGVTAPNGWGAIVVDCGENIRNGRFVAMREIMVGGREIYVDLGVFIDPTREPRDPFNPMRQRIRAGDVIGELILVPMPDFEVRVAEMTLSNIIPFPELKVA